MPVAPARALPALVLATLSLAACASLEPSVQDARDRMTGWTGEQVLACMGPPTSVRDQGASAVWSYSQTSAIGPAGEVADPTSTTFQYSPFSAEESLGAAAALPPPPQCTVALGMDSGRVLTVNYLGTWGGRLARSSLCGARVAPCLR